MITITFNPRKRTHRLTCTPHRSNAHRKKTAPSTATATTTNSVPLVTATPPVVTPPTTTNATTIVPTQSATSPSGAVPSPSRSDLDRKHAKPVPRDNDGMDAWTSHPRPLRPRPRPSSKRRARRHTLLPQSSSRSKRTKKTCLLYPIAITTAAKSRR